MNGFLEFWGINRYGVAFSGWRRIECPDIIFLALIDRSDDPVKGISATEHGNDDPGRGCFRLLCLPKCPELATIRI